jgi:hypothetical protein
LIDVQTKKQHKRVVAVKQKCNREESKRMWYSIKQTVKDPLSLSILRVQQVMNGEIKESVVQEDIEQAIQRGCKVYFSPAHSAPIMKTILRERL